MNKYKLFGIIVGIFMCGAASAASSDALDAEIIQSLNSEPHEILFTLNTLYNKWGQQGFDTSMAVQDLRSQRIMIQNQEAEIQLLQALCKATKGCKVPG